MIVILLFHSTSESAMVHPFLTGACRKDGTASMFIPANREHWAVDIYLTASSPEETPPQKKGVDRTIRARPLPFRSEAPVVERTTKMRGGHIVVHLQAASI